MGNIDAKRKKEADKKYGPGNWHFTDECPNPDTCETVGRHVCTTGCYCPDCASIEEDLGFN